jgi:predicted transposase YdaD
MRVFLDSIVYLFFANSARPSRPLRARLLFEGTQRKKMVTKSTNYLGSSYAKPLVVLWLDNERKDRRKYKKSQPEEALFEFESSALTERSALGGLGVHEVTAHQRCRNAEQIPDPDRAVARPHGAEAVGVGLLK